MTSRDLSLSRDELDAIGGKDLSRRVDSPPSAWTVTPPPKTVDTDANPETGGFTRRKGRVAKNMDVQPMPPEREPATTRPPSRRNWSSSAAETSSGPSSDGVPPTKQKLPLTVPKDASAVVAKSPPVVRKEPTSQATIKPAAKASAKAKPARLNASAASRIMKGKSAAEAIGATIPDFSATPQPRPRAGDDEAAPSRITHPTLDEDGEDDAVKLAKQRRRLAEGESMVAYIDDMGVDWKLASKRFKKDPDEDQAERMSTIWEDGSQDGIDDIASDGASTPSQHSAGPRICSRSRTIGSNELGGTIGNITSEGQPERQRRRSRTLEDLELDQIKNKANQFEGVVFHDLADLTPQDLKRAGISLSEPSLDDGRVKVEKDVDDDDDVATDENNRSDDIGDAYPVCLEENGDNKSSSTLPTSNSSPVPTRPRFIQRQSSTMATICTTEAEVRDSSPHVSTLGSGSPEPEVKVREFKVKQKRRDDEDDDNKSMVSGMTSMTKRSSQSGKSGSRKQQSMQHAAATAGTLVKLDKMLEAGMDANLTDEEDYTVLMRAVESGNGHIVVRLLKDDHINPSHAEQFKGRTAMHIACMKGMYGIAIELLKDPRVQVRAEDVKGRTPLHLAVIGNHHDVVQILLAHKGNDPNAKDNEGRAPVHLGTYHSALTALSILLKHPDVDPNVRDNEGRTAMHIAAARCLTGAAVHLIKNPRLNPDVADKEGFTPLHVCAFSALPEPGKVRSGEALIRETESQSSAGDPAGKIMEVLLEHPQADPNHPTSQGLTPLHLTVRHGRPTLAMLLIAHEKTEIMQKDRRGMTPLDMARKEDSQALEFLLESAMQQEHESSMLGADDAYTTSKRRGSQQRPSSAPKKGRVMAERSRCEWRGILHSTVNEMPPKFRPTMQEDTRPPWQSMTRPALTPTSGGQINMTDTFVGTPMPIAAMKHGAETRKVDRGMRTPRPTGTWSFERAGDFGSPNARLRREYDVQTLRYALRRKRIAAAALGTSTPDGKFRHFQLKPNTKPWVIEEWH